jgi:hypothetical protein
MLKLKTVADSAAAAQKLRAHRIGLSAEKAEAASSHPETPRRPRYEEDSSNPHARSVERDNGMTEDQSRRAVAQWT